MSEWPKVRPELDPAYRAIYEDHMARNRGGGSALNKAALRMEEWMHRKAALPRANTILELGGGNLNHLRFEHPSCSYSVIEPLGTLVEASPLAARVDYLGDYEDLFNLARDRQRSFDKVLSIAVLEHLEDLPSVVAASAVILADRGAFVAGIPSEGGWLWRTSWQATTGRAFRKRYGLDYDRLMAWEHINTEPEILAVIRTFFADVRVRRFPGSTLNLSLYTAVLAGAPRRDTALTHLSLKRSG